MQVLEQAVVSGHTECRVDIPMTTDTTQEFTLEVVASTDNMYDGSHRMILDVRTYDSNQNHWIWQVYALPQVEVSHLVLQLHGIARTKQCIILREKPYEINQDTGFML